MDIAEILTKLGQKPLEANSQIRLGIAIVQWCKATLEKGKRETGKMSAQSLLTCTRSDVTQPTGLNRHKGTRENIST